MTYNEHRIVASILLVSLSAMTLQAASGLYPSPALEEEQPVFTDEIQNNSLEKSVWRIAQVASHADLQYTMSQNIGAGGHLSPEAPEFSVTELRVRVSEGIRYEGYVYRGRRWLEGDVVAIHNDSLVLKMSKGGQGIVSIPLGNITEIQKRYKGGHWTAIPWPLDDAASLRSAIGLKSDHDIQYEIAEISYEDELEQLKNSLLLHQKQQRAYQKALEIELFVIGIVLMYVVLRGRK